MKYLSSKPFTGGANSKAYVDRWEEIFGKKDPEPSDPFRYPDHPCCGIRVKESPCILPPEHSGGHYTQSERTDWRARTSNRDDERLDILVDGKLRSYKDPHPCDGDAEVSAAKDRTPFTAIDRQIAMAGLERRLKEAYLDQHALTLDVDEIFLLVLLFRERREPEPEIRHDPFDLFQLEYTSLRFYVDAPDTFVGFFKRLLLPWARSVGTDMPDIKMLAGVPSDQVEPGSVLTPGQFLGLFPDRNRLGEPRPKFQ